MAKQSEKHSLEEKQKKGRGTKRKQDWNGDEPVVKKRAEALIHHRRYH